MRLLWSDGPATVLELQAGLGEDLADSTIRTLLGILIDKGYVSRRKEGRAFVYEAAAERGRTRQKAVRDLVDRFFGTPGHLVLNIVKSEELGPEELAELRRMLDEHATTADLGSGRDA